MVKIKVEKKMNLAELVQYIIENDITDSSFKNEDGEDITVWGRGKLYITDHWDVGRNHINPKSLFTVVVEEEITEETKVPQLLEIYSYSGRDSINACVYNDESIGEERDADSISFHMVNPDSTLTLLWTEEGGMVE